jgi:hypothetical protein
MNRKHLRSKDAYKNSILISFFICTLTIIFFLPSSEEFAHWFLIPIVLSGILIGIDAVDWFLGRLNIFDPVGIIGLLGLHFFFLAPLLHISWDVWLLTDATHPPDWQPWLGGMAILNFLGLCVYRWFRKLAATPKKDRDGETVWRINYKRFPLIISLAIAISAVIQIFVYLKFGGLGGYINTATDLTIKDEAFAGVGWLLMFSDNFPILAMIGFVAYAKKNKKLRTWPIIIAVLLVFIVLKLLFGGLRGSRSNIVWSLFWATGIVHFWLRPISKKQVAIGLVFLVFFMYMYGFFKSGGLEGISTALEGQEARASLEEKSGRTWSALILGDFGRSDLQAFLLYRMMRPDSDYEYAWGRTYFAAASILIPGPLWPWPEKPPSKSKEGTDAQFGMGAYAPKIWVSSKVYGLAGETMLNFGPFVVPLAFSILGIVVGRVKLCLLTWESSDCRALLLPMLTNLCFVILTSDADNILFFIMKSGAFPFMVIALSSKKEFLPVCSQETRLLLDEGDSKRRKPQC